MPLSPPEPRTHHHTRRIEIRGYERDDALWDIEGHLTDTKSSGFENRDRGWIAADEPIHEMWLRLTIDDSFMIHRAEAATDHGPYRICGDITPNFVELKGIRIGPGWRRQALKRVGGTRGCTHLVELLGPMATAAYQTLWPALERRRREPVNARENTALVNSCHAYASDSEIVKRNWPEAYTGP